MSETNPPQFGAMLRALLINAGIVTRMGNPDWTGLVRQMQGVNYESLRKAVVGERPPSEKIRRRSGTRRQTDSLHRVPAP